MLKLIAKPILLAITFSALPAIASANGSVPSIGAGNSIGFQTKPEAKFTVSCGAGNFIGYAEGVLGATRYSEYVRIDRYRIVKLNGQQGGNKANVNLTSIGKDGSKGEEKSADRMNQDGQWHNLKTGTSHIYPGLQSAHVEFIFDKSGSDPRCKTQI